MKSNLSVKAAPSGRWTLRDKAPRSAPYLQLSHDVAGTEWICLMTEEEPKCLRFVSKAKASSTFVALALFFTTNRPYRNSYYGDFSRNTRNSISLSFLRAVRSGPAPSLSVRTALLGKWPSLASQKFAHDQFFAQIENISRNALILCT